MFKDLNERKLPNQWKFFSSRSSGGGSELNGKKMGKKGTLNENNNIFLDYLLTGYVRKILAKNKMKIHLETGNICCNNINMQSIYDFLLAQQDETKNLIDYEIDLSDNFNFHLNGIFAPITTIKMIWILIVRLNLYSIILIIQMLDLNEDAYKIRRIIVSDDQYALEFLQSKD